MMMIDAVFCSNSEAEGSSSWSLWGNLGQVAELGYNPYIRGRWK